MAPVSRFLQANSPPLPLPSTTSSTAAPPQPPLAVDSDVVVILAALLCALICVVGLAAVARCAWTRRSNPAAPPNKGLKKKTLESLPKFQYQSSELAQLAECAICLERFVEGEEVRVLPHCGHGFHAVCIDTWLGSHSSCPSCRRILVVPPALPPANGKCRMCGGARAADVEMAVKAREDGQSSNTTGFLP